MKKIVFFVFLFLLLSVIVSPSSRSEEDIFYALCPKSLNNPFWDDVKVGMEKAAKELGVKAEFVAPIELDASQQVQKIEALLERKVDGIAISPTAPGSVVDVIAEARAKGIPVICFDADSPDSERLCYVGTFNEQAGYEAGNLLKEYLPDGGTVLAVSGGAAAANLNERVDGFKRALKGSNIKIADVQYCNDDMNRATQLIEGYLSANPDLDAIFGVGLWSAIPAANIRRDKGLNYVVIGFDTMEPELQLIKDGYMEAVVGQLPVEMGYHAVMTLDRLRKAGDKMEEIADDFDTGTVTVRRDDVEAFARKAGIELK
ncbi:MAG: sugar-binding protein [Candidatus Omnitrophica bacterium]|nr:sugar-binding protein [Candidatus Omnitrophota bacterium]MCA9417046.1 sugar-binding protein [Candidatus Omnitrophota bacterium]MCA9429071.1 sugar-binding protein [Candidatus Omnitrophota bacterium]MCA9440560.1 sugar-binding protein [Candidatus Omnitrophota bacterium]MCA9446848.1 sugar-binding protein [Candidatus Omnitrophota bacterium]